MNKADRTVDTTTSSDGAANRLLGASALALLGAGAGGWIAYDQTDSIVQTVALTLAFASMIASITLALLALGSEDPADEPKRAADSCPVERGRRWNGTGSPRTAGNHRRPARETMDRHSAV